MEAFHQGQPRKELEDYGVIFVSGEIDGEVPRGSPRRRRLSMAHLSLTVGENPGREPADPISATRK